MCKKEKNPSIKINKITKSLKKLYNLQNLNLAVSKKNVFFPLFIDVALLGVVFASPVIGFLEF